MNGSNDFDLVKRKTRRGREKENKEENGTRGKSYVVVTISSSCSVSAKEIRERVGDSKKYAFIIHFAKL